MEKFSEFCCEKDIEVEMFPLEAIGDTEMVGELGVRAWASMPYGSAHTCRAFTHVRKLHTAYLEMLPLEGIGTMGMVG